MSRSALATAINSIADSSRDLVTDRQVIPILATGDGPGHLVRALFGDCSLETLDRLGAECGLPHSQILASHGIAKQRHAASNADIDGH